MSTAEDGEQTPPVWNRHEPLGAGAGGTTFGIVAAPLLAGFSLTAVVELVTREDGGVRGDVAVAAFAVAAGLLVFTIQASISANRYQVSPADRIAWTPEALADPHWLTWLRDRQWRDEDLASWHRRNAKRSYNAGIVAFLAGLVAVLVPDPGDWRPGRTVALAAGVLALLVEVLLVTGRPRFVRRVLMPTITDYQANGRRPWHSEVPAMDPDDLRGMVGPTDDVAAVLASVDVQLARLTDQLSRMEPTVVVRRWRWWSVDRR